MVLVVVIVLIMLQTAEPVSLFYVWVVIETSQLHWSGRKVDVRTWSRPCWPTTNELSFAKVCWGNDPVQLVFPSLLLVESNLTLVICLCFVPSSGTHGVITIAKVEQSVWKFGAQKTVSVIVLVLLYVYDRKLMNVVNQLHERRALSDCT